MKGIVAAYIKVNAPNGLTFAFIKAAEVKGWVEVGLVITSIICTILLTRAEIRRREKL